MTKAVSTINNMIDKHLIPLLRDKLGGGWRKVVKLGANKKTNRAFLTFVNIPRTLFQEVRSALFNMARGINAHASVDNRHMRLSLTFLPA